MIYIVLTLSKEPHNCVMRMKTITWKYFILWHITLVTLYIMLQNFKKSCV